MQHVVSCWSLLWLTFAIAGYCRTLSDIVGSWYLGDSLLSTFQHISAHFSTILQFFDWNFPGMDVELPELRKAGEQGRRHEKELEGTVNRICCSLELQLQKISSCNGFSIHGGSGPQQSGLAKKTKAARAVNATDSIHLQTSPDSSDQSLGKFRAFPSTAL
jgi:hypothetical protein